MNRIAYKLTFLSDWAVFDGQNHSGIDNHIVKNNQGLPYIPGRSIKGIYREAFEEIGEYLDKEKYSSIEELLGKERENKTENRENSSIRFSNAELQDDFINDFKKLNNADREFIKNNMTINIPRIRVDEKTGMTDDKALAMLEMGRKGMEFLFHISKVDNSDLTEKELSAIGILSDYIKRMGSMRNRGKGRCQIVKLEGGQNAAN